MEVLLPVVQKVCVDQGKCKGWEGKSDLTTFIELMVSCMTPTPPSFLVGRGLMWFCE